ncbi:glutathione S-transferase [Aspergillus terreus]|uniref:Glutathione S-transferase n=1 Tax=Aspergillus terreus TaxID=33178 RepID=A0A5M3YRB5_ASPTE|nr:hypothetical protein ATETN484_0001082200 [Aspergillus terreus]GFF12677.1 glutathione S-transferase [Aspergillus terreus]
MAKNTPPHFFDITSTLPGASQSWSPNTMRTRMVLNYKRIRYTQSFISYPDIAPLLSHLAVQPHAQGMPYTLPAIVHPSVSSNPNGALMDSLAIAAHLDQTYPSPPLFPAGDASYALTLAVARLVSKVVAQCAPLVIPNVADLLDPRGREYFIKTRSARFGRPLSEVRPRDKDELRAMVDAAKAEFVPIAQMLLGRLGKRGPFFEGERPSYADFLVVSLLVWFERADRPLFEEFAALGDGAVRALWEACLPWVNGQGEEKEWPVPR